MIGLIISGHGHFASGLKTSLHLIAGECEYVEFVDFEASDSTDDLKAKYYEALENLKDCDSFLALADLPGGSPFKTLVEVKFETGKDIEVISGTNLPMVLEAATDKDSYDDVASFADTILETGKDGIVKYEYVARTEVACEDGI